MEDGIWRTISGRRVYIKNGQSLTDAMRNSGKFESKKDKARKSFLLKEERYKLSEKLKKGNLDNEEYEKIKEKIKEITKEKQEIDKDLTDEERQEARREVEKERYDIENKHSIDDEKQYNQIIKENEKKLDNEIENELNGIEKFEEDYGIDSQIIDDMYTNTMKKIDEMHENGEISDFGYEKYIDTVHEKASNIMNKKGYEYYIHNGKGYYSMLPKAKESYDGILDELNKKRINYKVSKSWNAGELPSIYIENENGDIFRIANHFNSKNQQFEAFSLDANKIYSTKDYINYKNTVLKDLKKWLEDTK